MGLVAQQDLDKYDIAFRSWAAQDPMVAQEVKKVDHDRQRFISTIFEDMGISGVDLETRLRAGLVYASSSRSVSFHPAQDDEEPNLEDVLDFFHKLSRPNTLSIPEQIEVLCVNEANER